VLLPVFRPDRHPRLASDDRHRDRRSGDGAGVASGLLACLLHPGRDHRPLLAFCRSRLDFPLSADLPQRTERRLMLKALRHLALAWVGLVLLLVLTLGLAYLPLGSANIVVALTIAAAKGIIVVLIFMKLAHSPPLTWIFAGAGLFWLALLFGVTYTD